MRIKIYPTSKVFIACPANVASGGPESLHQLAYHLRNDFQVEALMYYYGFDNYRFESPIHPEYTKYNIPFVMEILQQEDNDENILIVPEIFSGLSLLSKYLEIRKGVWFLSVDNYYFSRMSLKDFFFPRVFNNFMKLINKPPIFDIYSENNLRKLSKKYDYKNDNFLKLADFYIVNSYRGIKWFRYFQPFYYLFGYINKDFIENESGTGLLQKEDIVVYNPIKGKSFNKKIIAYAKGITFVPLVNMTREEVIKILKKAKVYIDFGNHPGKDRLPREAGILGCCVITGKRGSAAFFEDVPIPEEYKFEDKEENIPEIIEKIKDCFENFEKRHKDFDYYRQVIKNEPQKFVEDLKKIFIKVN